MRDTAKRDDDDSENAAQEKSNTESNPNRTHIVTRFGSVIGMACSSFQTRP
jgi:hypothetical protein